MRSSILLLAALCAACSAESPEAAGENWMTHPGVQLDEANARAVELALQPPDPACLQVYRVSVSYDVAPLQEEDYSATLVLAPHERREQPRSIQRGRPIPPSETATARLFYDGFRSGKRGAQRDAYLGRTLAGPASPTAACFARTWDPMEDSLSLGWPKLSGRLTAVGEQWVGARVEGKCNKNACINPETFAGGAANHHLACVTEDWQETLVGIFRTTAGTYAAIESTWSDGNGSLGIQSERKTIFSVDHGRPVWSRTVIHHAFPQPTNDRSFSPIERTWSLEAIDACPGSLVDAGWTIPEDLAAMAEAGPLRMAEFNEPKRKRQSRTPAPPAE